MPGSHRLRWSPQAVLDLRRLRDFIRVHNPDAARRAEARIRESTRRLQAFPRSGRPVIKLEDADKFRDLYIPFGQAGYWLRYRLGDKVIYILKIWHTREKPPI